MFRYRLTPSAQQDLRTIRDYIRDVLAAPDSAAGLMEAFENAFERACRHPLALPPVTDARLQGRGYRKLIVQNYIALILPDQQAECLDVMRVFYYAQNYRELL